MRPQLTFTPRLGPGEAVVSSVGRTRRGHKSRTPTALGTAGQRCPRQSEVSEGTSGARVTGARKPQQHAGKSCVPGRKGQGLEVGWPEDTRGRGRRGRASGTPGGGAAPTGAGGLGPRRPQRVWSWGSGRALGALAHPAPPGSRGSETETARRGPGRCEDAWLRCLVETDRWGIQKHRRRREVGQECVWRGRQAARGGLSRAAPSLGVAHGLDTEGPLPRGVTSLNSSLSPPTLRYPEMTFLCPPFAQMDSWKAICF